MPIITGHITPLDQAASDYFYVPFDVPSGVARIEVAYAHSHPRHHGELRNFFLRNLALHDAFFAVASLATRVAGNRISFSTGMDLRTCLRYLAPGCSDAQLLLSNPMAMV